MKRPRLVLARETLSRLTPDDLADVHGGSLTYPTCLTVYTGMTRCTVCMVTEKCGATWSCITCPCS